MTLYSGIRLLLHSALVSGSDTPLTLPVYTMPSSLAYMPGQSSVQTVLALAAPTRPEGWSSGMPQTIEVSREGPFDAYAAPMDTEDSPLVTKGLPGCLYLFTSYTGPAVADSNPAFGLQLHHHRFLEFIGVPESARLLYHSPTFWIQRLREEDAMAAAVNLQRDAGLMSSNLQILSQFVTSLDRMSSEMMSLGLGHVVFPSGNRRSAYYGSVAATRVRAITGRCRPRPVLTVGTVFRTVVFLRSSVPSSSFLPWTIWFG